MRSRRSRSRAKVKDVALLGFSLGGNVSLEAGGSVGGAPAPYVRGVATISAPLDLVETSRALETLRTLPYRGYVLRKLVAPGARVRARSTRAARAYDAVAPPAPAHDPRVRRGGHRADARLLRRARLLRQRELRAGARRRRVPDAGRARGGRSDGPRRCRCGAGSATRPPRCGSRGASAAGTSDGSRACASRRGSNTWAIDRVSAFVRATA